jgi:hypothetical protein
MAATKTKTKAKAKTTSAKAKPAKKADAVNVSSKKKSSSKNLSTDNVFYLSNGQVISSLKDLPKILKEMDDATYYYHVTDTRNDFSAWISDVFGNSKLAMSIGDIKDRSDMIKAIKKGI